MIQQLPGTCSFHGNYTKEKGKWKQTMSLTISTKIQQMLASTHIPLAKQA